MTQPATIYRCNSCGAIIGNCNGRQLVIGAALFERKPVTVRCYMCAGSQTWYPPKENSSEIPIDVKKSVS